MSPLDVLLSNNFFEGTISDKRNQLYTCRNGLLKYPHKGRRATIMLYENNIIKTECTQSLDETCKGGLGYFCFKYMQKFKENIAQINISTEEQDTYDTLLKKSIRTAIMLQKLGIKKGDIVTICSRPNLNSYVPMIACFLIGAVPAYLDITFPPFEVKYFARSINPKLFLVASDDLDPISEIIKSEHPNVEITAFSDDYFQPQEEEGDFLPVYIEDLAETAIIHFSSGSTGLPKGICLNHRTYLSNIPFSFENLWVEGAPKVVLSFDTLHWTVESLRLISSIKEGVCRLISSNEADMERIWYFLEKYKVNLAYLIPLYAINMIDKGKPKDINLRYLTTIYVEGSLLPVKYHETVREFLPHVDIFHWYGLTETGLLLTFRKIDSHREFNRKKPSCNGVPISGFGISYKIVDVQNGEALGPNNRGELRVKSNFLMNGYSNADSSKEYDEDGWFKTGDVVYYDDDLCFFVVGRIKGLILYQGWHIVPALLEAQLLKHPAVKIAAVVGIPDVVDNEHALALVALNDGFESVTAAEIQKYVDEKVPEKYNLKGGVKIIDESYFKTRNKINRFKLKQLVISGEI